MAWIKADACDKLVSPPSPGDPFILGLHGRAQESEPSRRDAPAGRNLTFCAAEPISRMRALRCMWPVACGSPVEQILLQQMSHFQKGFTPCNENEVDTFLTLHSCLFHLPSFLLKSSFTHFPAPCCTDWFAG